MKKAIAVVGVFTVLLGTFILVKNGSHNIIKEQDGYTYTDYNSLNQGSEPTKHFEDFINSTSNKEILVIFHKNECSKCKALESDLIAKLNDNKQFFPVSYEVTKGFPESLEKYVPEKMFLSEDGKIHTPTILKVSLDRKTKHFTVKEKVVQPSNEELEQFLK